MALSFVPPGDLAAFVNWTASPPGLRRGAARQCDFAEERRLSVCALPRADALNKGSGVCAPADSSL